MDGFKPRLPSERRFAGSPVNSPPLLRCLAGLGVAEVAASTQSLAERWSPWLAWTDAITLSAVLGNGALGAPGTPGTPGTPASAGPDARAVIDDCQRLCRELRQAMATGAPVAAGQGGSTALAGHSLPLDDAGLASLHRHYQARQRAMDEGIAPLRARLRAALASQPGKLARLAALDAVLDQALAARQRRLLASVPGWLDQHFKRAPLALPAALAALQRMLLAELDLRLQPVEALADALAQAAGKPASKRATTSTTTSATISATTSARTQAGRPA